MKLTLMKFIGLGILALSLFKPQAAFSEPEEDDCPDCPKEEERIKLDDVFVHAFGGGAVTLTPTSTIVDVDKYVKAGNVERIEDILMSIAGINVMKSSGSLDPQAVVLMRGFDDSRFIVAMDGRPITGSTGKTNTAIDWSSITLADVEKIEIIRGGASAKYEAAEGGVINLIMKKGTKRDTLVPKMTYTQDYSQIFDYSDPSSHGERITADGGLGGLTYFLNYGYRSSEDYLKNNDYRGYDYSGRFNYRLPNEGLFSFSYKGTEYKRNEPVVNDPRVVPGFVVPPGGATDTVGPDILPYDPDYPTVPWDADTPRSTASAVSFNYPGTKAKKERKVENWDGSYEQPLGNTTLKIYGYYTENEEENWYVKPNGDQVHNEGPGYVEKHFGGGFTWSLNPWEDNSLTLGYNYKLTEAGDMEDIYKIHAGYFDDLWIISPRWTLKTGLRVTKLRHGTYPLQLPGETSKTRHYFYEWFLLPKVALTYNFQPETNFYVSVSRDYDIPGC